MEVLESQEDLDLMDNLGIKDQEVNLDCLDNLVVLDLLDQLDL